jgi:cytochrome bd-type quinol oxidase subunit 2
VSGGSAILSWLLLIVYGIAYAVSWKGGSLKAWKFRVGYLAVTLLSFAVALVSGAIYEMSKGDSRNNTSFYVVSATAFVVACTTAQLFQKGRQQAKAESTPSPTP